jgi:hypothetical protein
MNYQSKTPSLLNVSLIAVAVLTSGLTASVVAQDSKEKTAVSSKKGGRDPFKKYEPVVKTSRANSKLEVPTIQARIERYRAQKMAAAAAHVPPPKPTTALLLNEMQVTGIFRTPRGWAAMVEATPIKLSYVIYPGETFFDGQLVAIEENRLIFRRETVWGDGRREKSVEIKPLRKATPVEEMTTAAAAPASAPVAEAKTSAPEKQ